MWVSGPKAKCFLLCPVGNPVERSQLNDLLKRATSGRHGDKQKAVFVSI